MWQRLFRRRVASSSQSGKTVLQWLANQLRTQGIVEPADNTFVACGDWTQAQALVGDFEIKVLAARLRALVEAFCPVVKQFRGGYHWSLM